MAEGRILHGDDLESVLERKEEASLDINLCNRPGPEQMTKMQYNTRHLGNIVCRLPQGFEDLFVVFQVDISEHVSSHCVSFAQVGLQAFFVDLPLKLGDDWPGLNQADTDNRWMFSPVSIVSSQHSGNEISQLKPQT